MTDQTPVTDDDRTAYRWAETHQNDTYETLAAVSRSILTHVPAPPKSLAEQMLDIAGGISSDFGAYADDLNALADRVDAVAKDSRENASKADQWEVTAKRLTRERDEARAERDDLQDIVDGSAADLQQRDDEIERLNAEVERLQEQEEARKDELHKYREIRKHQRDELARLNAEVEAIRNALLYDGGSLPPGMTVAEAVEHLSRTFDRLNPDLLAADRAPVTASSATLPDPADVPTAQPWLVRDDQGLCLGLRCEPKRVASWYLLRVRNGVPRWCIDDDVTLVRPIDLDGLDINEVTA